MEYIVWLQPDLVRSKLRELLNILGATTQCPCTFPSHVTYEFAVSITVKKLSTCSVTIWRYMLTPHTYIMDCSKLKLGTIHQNQNSKIKHTRVSQIYVLKHNLYIPDEITTTIVAARRTLNKIIQICE